MHIALLIDCENAKPDSIDCENAKPDSIDGILGELAAKGTINIRRAYGNWKNQAGWEARLHPFAIQPIQQFSYTKGKNALDMCMAIDAMDLLYTEKVDCFALVTSDSDFTPLVIKLLSKGKTVIGFGESKTPEPFVKACSVFIHTDDFKEPSAENPATSRTTRKTRNELRGDSEYFDESVGESHHAGRRKALSRQPNSSALFGDARAAPGSVAFAVSRSTEWRQARRSERTALSLPRSTAVLPDLAAGPSAPRPRTRSMTSGIPGARTPERAAVRRLIRRGGKDVEPREATHESFLLGRGGTA